MSIFVILGKNVTAEEIETLAADCLCRINSSPTTNAVGGDDESTCDSERSDSIPFIPQVNGCCCCVYGLSQ